jgi:uncharacterized protein YjlB
MPSFESLQFADDGLVPNNPTLALRLYRGALPLEGADPSGALIRHFATHGWGGAWVNGIYPFQHYHATAHEVLGLAAGWARVQFGGPSGPILRVTTGDAVLIPAGVGHCAMATSPDLTVVGAYPRGQETYDLKRATPAEHARALTEIPRVPLPVHDPVTGLPFLPGAKTPR